MSRVYRMDGTIARREFSTSLNPVPVISSIDPDEIDTGSGAQTITINGSNFLPTSAARFAGNARVTNYISSTELEIELLSGDVEEDGIFSIQVFNPGPGGGGSNVENLTINASLDPDFGNVVALIQNNTGSTVQHIPGTTMTVVGSGGVSSARGPFTPMFSFHNPNPSGFNRSNYVRLTASDSRFIFDGEFTWEGFFNVDTLPAGAANFFSSFTVTLANWFVLYVVSDGSMGIFRTSGAVLASAAGVITVDNWKHIAVTRNAANRIDIWVNGVSVANTTNSVTLGADTGGGASEMDVMLGMDAVSNTDLNGYFDQVRITKGVCRYTASFTPPTEPFPNS